MQFTFLCFHFNRKDMAVGDNLKVNIFLNILIIKIEMVMLIYRLRN